jgi:membrane protease YdiL (CAAX protease family)
VETAEPQPESCAPAPVAAVAIRFCSGCGTPRDPSETDCSVCALRRASRSVEQNWTADRSFVRTAIWLYFSLLAVSIIALLIALSTEKEVGVAGIAIEEVFMGIITIAWCVHARAELLPVLRTSAAPRWLFLGIASAVPTFAIASLVLQGMHSLLGLEILRYLDSFERDGYGPMAAVIAICVFPAIFEELSFRGVILTSLQRVLSNREAMLVSALMFAVLHLSVLSLPHLFLLGAILAWLRVRTGSLFPGMLLHFTHNLLCILVEQHRSILPW